MSYDCLDNGGKAEGWGAFLIALEAGAELQGARVSGFDLNRTIETGNGRIKSRLLHKVVPQGPLSRPVLHWRLAPLARARGV